MNHILKLQKYNTNYISILILIIISSLFFGAYGLGTVSDEEDLSATLLSTLLFTKALIAGESPFWTPTLGLGIPQPFRIALIFHPLSFLFSILPPLLAIKIVVFTHGIISALSFYLLCKKLSVSPFISCLSSISFIFCTSNLNFLFTDDWPSFFLSFSFLPLICLLFLNLIDETLKIKKIKIALYMSLTIGIFIATGLASSLLTYVIVLSVFCLFPIRHCLRERYLIFLIILISSSISLGLLTTLYNELVQFPDNVSRHYHLNRPILQHIHSSLNGHLFQTLWNDPSQIFQTMTKRNLRLAGFGLPALLLALSSFLIKFNENERRVRNAFVGSVILIQFPPSFFNDIVSATWFFRDGINIFGILLFGITLEKIRNTGQPRRKLIVSGIFTFQLFFTSIQALPFCLRSIYLQSEETKSPTLSKLSRSSFLDKLQNKTGVIKGRVAMSPSLTSDRKILFPDGFVNNLGAFQNIHFVNAEARGIATSQLYPDRYLMEGHIGVTKTNLLDKHFLDVLGIEYLITKEKEIVSKNLKYFGQINTKSSGILNIWKNLDYWPRVVEFPVDFNLTKLENKLECEHQQFLCSNFSSLTYRAKQFPAKKIRETFGSISFELQPSNVDRDFILTSWYRTGWVPADRKVAVFPALGQFIGLKVPAGIREVKLNFIPSRLVFAYIISFLAIMINALGIAVLALRQKNKS